MSHQKSNYDLLIEKLDQFIRKFYVNRLIKGCLYTIGLVLFSFLLFTIAEYYFYFGTGVRKFLLVSFVGISTVSVFRWVLIPVIHYFKLGQIISHEKAAEIVGEHFSGVKDKLVNILQLNRQLTDPQSQSLILASIQQKSKEVQPLRFQSAIDLSKNKKYLPYALPPLLLFLGLIVGAPTMIKDPANRILKSNTVFERDAPFHFVLETEELETGQFNDFSISVVLTGDYLPQQAYVVINGFQYRMQKEGPAKYSYVFKNLQQDQAFSFSSEGVSSQGYLLRVMKRPNVLDFNVEMDYPSYLNRIDESVNNVGDLVVPEGTKIDWVFQSVNTNSLSYRFGNNEYNPAQRLGQNAFTFNHRLRSSTEYQIVLGNEALPESDSVSYHISVVPDQYPSISLRQFVDSADLKLLYLVGDASDDHGLSLLTFNYAIDSDKTGEGEVHTIELQVSGTSTTYEHLFDLNLLNLQPGDNVRYYFEVWDNDGINGSKQSRSTTYTFRQPTKEEFKEKEDKNEEDIKRSLEKSLQESKDINEDFKKLREKMLQEKNIDWQTKKELQELLDRHKDLEEQIEDAKEKFEENLENQQEFEETPPEITEKQEQLQELFEELADEETRELMQKIQELMEELNKDETLQMMQEMEMSEEEMSMELERLKELFKQLEVERDIMQEMEKLKELAKQQTELAQESQNEDKLNKKEEVEEEEEDQSSSLEEKQEGINETFEEIKKNLEEIEKRNNETKAPKDMGDHQEESKDIQQDLEKSLDQLQKQQNSNASKTQQNAGQKMQQMAQQMEQNMQSGDMQQMQEDMKAMRQLLENLVDLSFDQEYLMDDFSRSQTSTPMYTSLIQQQNKLKEDFLLIEDSLEALSQRVYQIESFVLEKVAEVNGHMGKSLELLEDRKKSQAGDNQQRVMKNVNDLALMFSESMSQMQQQMAAMMSGQQMCNKPGMSNPKDGEGPPLDKITEGQKELNGEMQKMGEKMKEGQDGQPGSKEFAQMAAKQAALRKALRDLQMEKQAQGKGSKELEEILEQMDKIETDLVNKRFTNQMLKRQEDILSRLLESEKAEREQEYDKERESNTGEELEKALPPAVEEYIKQREAHIEPFKTVSPSLKPYYKQLVEEYYKSLKEN